MGLLNWLFKNNSNICKVPKRRKRTMFYHVYRNSNTYENDPACTFTCRWRAYSFARRISKQNKETACVVYTYKSASELNYDRVAENYRYGGN